MQNETVKRELVRLRVDPAFASGKGMDDEIAATTERFKSVVVEKQSNVPNFTSYVAGIVAVLLLWVIFETLTRKPDALLQPKSEFVIDSQPYQRRPGIAAACFFALALYVYLLGKGWLPFAVASAAMVLVVGGVMSKETEVAGRFYCS